MRNGRFYEQFRLAVHREPDPARFSFHLAVFSARILAGPRIRLAYRSLRVQMPFPVELCLSDTWHFVFAFSAGPQNQSSADAVDLPDAVFLLRFRVEQSDHQPRVGRPVEDRFVGADRVQQSDPVHLCIVCASAGCSRDESRMEGGMVRPDQSRTGRFELVLIVQIQPLFYLVPTGGS